MDVIESINIFKRIAERGSFSQAAKDLRLSQPAVSKALGALEKRLGVTLVRRTTRGLQLTGEGKNVLSHSYTLLEQVEALYSAAQSEQFQLQGLLRVTASQALARLVLAPMLVSFQDKYPGLTLNLQLSDGYLDLIESNIDVALRIGKLMDSAHKAQRIGSSQRGLYGSREYLERFGVPQTLDELSQHRLLSYSRVHDGHAWPFQVRGEEKLFEFRPYLQTDGSDVMRETLLLGMGLAYLPTWMVTQAEATGEVTRLLPRIFQNTSPIYAVTPASRTISLRQRVIIDFLREQFERRPDLSLRGKTAYG